MTYKTITVTIKFTRLVNLSSGPNAMEEKEQTSEGTKLL